jgi:hypothetical protein
MAKGETKKTNKMLEAEQKKTNQQFDQFSNVQGARSNEAYGRSNETYQKLLSGYGDMAAGNLLGGAPAGGFGGGGYSLPSTYGEVASSYRNFMGGGGVDENAMRVGHGTLNELQGTGGYDAESKARIMGDVAKYRDFAQTGGVNEADRARMRGSGVFDEFAKTGGVSAQEAGNLRARGTAPISAMYGGMTEEAARGRRIRGGSGAMSNAYALKAARDQSRAGAEAALNTELGISDRVRSGRQWGAEGAATSEGALQGLVTGNQLAGLQGASSTEMGMNNAIAGTRLGAATNIGASEQNIQGLIQKGRMFGTQGLEGVAGAEAAAASSGSSASAADARFREGLREEGLRGLYNLRGQTPGESPVYDENILRSIGGRGGLVNDQLNMRYNAPGNNTSGWQQAGQIAGGIAGMAGGLMTGAGALRGMGGGGINVGQQMPMPYNPYDPYARR